tara:strand:+ start:85 stop:918 length:834 start_codon:yes stop_codon:yes gene_type:complete
VKHYWQKNKTNMNEPNKKFKIVTDTRARVILPNTLTLVGVCIGLSSINFALNQNYKLAIISILFAAIIDGLDGRIARLIKGTSKVGKELDSLTDIISFGVAPAFIMYFWSLNSLGKIGWLLSLIYVVCVALRLARFNLNVGAESSWKDNFFEGVPSPAGGILILTPLIYDVSGLALMNLNYKIIVPTIFIVVSILLISKFPTYAFKKISVKRSITVFLMFSIMLLFGLLLMFPFQTLVAGSIFYILSLPISYFHFLKLEKKNKSENLFDHEEPEDFL